MASITKEKLTVTTETWSTTRVVRRIVIPPAAPEWKPDCSTHEDESPGALNPQDPATNDKENR